MADFDVMVTDNTGEFLRALLEQIERALIAIGLTAESYAKEDCPVDTGRLRNSISHAVDMGDNSVYIGSNVEYAAFVELGTSRMAPRPYLGPAATEHAAEYRSLAEQALRNG